MTILPGSLDYLYYNGILDHIPYEAYEYPSVGQSGNNVRQELGGVIGTPGSYVQEYAMNSGSAYMDSAMSGSAYQNSLNTNDTFTKSYDMNNTSVQNTTIQNTSAQNNSARNLSIHDEILGSDGRAMMASKQAGYGAGADFGVSADGHGSIKESVLGKDSADKPKVMNKPLILKGLAGALIMAGTLFLILRGKKKP